MPFTIQPRPFMKYNPCSRDQIHSLFKQKQSSLLFPTPAWGVLAIPPSESLGPVHMPHRKFHGHISLP